MTDTDALAGRVITDVCELPDRTSPEDRPDMMLVTAGELSVILGRHFAEALTAQAQEIERLRALLREARDAQEKFAQVAEWDIGDSETDDDVFRPMGARGAVAGLITVGDIRRAGSVYDRIDAALAGTAGDGWRDIETPPEGEAVVVIFHPRLHADKDFPGLPVVASNPEYVRSGHAKQIGYTLWCRLPPLPAPPAQEEQP